MDQKHERDRSEFDRKADEDTRSNRAQQTEDGRLVVHRVYELDVPRCVDALIWLLFHAAPSADGLGGLGDE
jgi:hypothetical protein